MFIIFLFILYVLIFRSKLHTKGLNPEYLSKENTDAVKGLFILLVFLSHIKGYIDAPILPDRYVISILHATGQLMVAMFLFVSGYGVCTSVMKKGDSYVKAFPKNRILKTFMDFAFAILLFYGVGLIVGNHYPLQRVLIAFTGWDSIGNSNWYMFTIFSLYILTYLSFRFFPKKPVFAIGVFTVLSLGFIYVIAGVRPSRFSNTVLCYTFGMIYAYFKPRIDAFFEKNMRGYYIFACVTAVMFAVAAIVYTGMTSGGRIEILAHNILSVLFCLVFIVIMMKVSFKSPALIWCGKRLFWIYILQRIPMILLSHDNLNVSSPYVFIFVCLGVTMFLSEFLSVLSKKFKAKIFKENK